MLALGLADGCLQPDLQPRAIPKLGVARGVTEGDDRGECHQIFVGRWPAVHQVNPEILREGVPGQGKDAAGLAQSDPSILQITASEYVPSAYI